MAALDLLPHLPLDLQLAVPLVPDAAMGRGDGRVPLQHRGTGIREPAIRPQERGGVFQRVEEQHTARGAREKAGVDR